MRGGIRKTRALETRCKRRKPFAPRTGDARAIPLMDDFIAFLERYQDAKRSVMIRQSPFKANLTKREDWFGEPYT